LGFDFHQLCTITKGGSVTNTNISDFDAALYGYVYKPGNSIQNLTIPSNVKQIIFHEEAGWRWNIDFRLNNAISVTYFSGSDIVAPYGKWIPFNEKTLKILSSIKKENKSELKRILHYLNF